MRNPDATPRCRTRRSGARRRDSDLPNRPRCPYPRILTCRRTCRSRPEAEDWWSTTAPSGGAVAVNSAYQNRSGNTTYAHTGDIFSIPVTLTPGKTVASVTLPPGGGYDLGWTGGSQWFNYTVNAATAGTYQVSFRVAAPSAVTDAFHLSNASGTNLSGDVNIAATGGWQTWTTVTANVTLTAGQQTVTLDEDNGGWNINYMTFA